MPIVEPQLKRTIAFFDGQNLFHAAKEAFGYPYPNYDPHSLANAVCRQKGWALSGIRFYTGIPDPTIDRQIYDACLDPNDYRLKKKQVRLGDTS